MTYNLRTSNTASEDLHRLVGQIIDHRLRVINLHYASPRQWLYQVEPPSVGKTRRALKVLGDPLAREPGAFYRLKTSYERLKRIDSPYIEQVYECGLLHDLTPYVLVSWEPHISLYEYMRRHRKPLKWEEARTLFLHISLGLESLHQSGVAHGDLRAQHILLCQPPGMPLIIDACINSAFGSPPVPGLDKSAAYWAPERNTLSTASTASDMYSFGVLMYFCLHNQLPFSPLHDFQYTQQLDQPSVISPMRWLEESHIDSSLPSFDPGIPTEICVLMSRLLSKSSRTRPTAGEVAKVLKGEKKLGDVVDSPDPSHMISTEEESKDSQGVDEEQRVNPLHHHSSEFTRRVEHYATTQTNMLAFRDEMVEPERTMSTTRALLIVTLSSVSVIIGLLLARL